MKNMETREGLLTQCRIYDGNDESYREFLVRDDMSYRFWQAERIFVDTQLEAEIENSIAFFRECKLIDTVPSGANVYLYACLFIEYCRKSDMDPEILTDSFRTEFVSEYLAQPLRRH